MKRFFEKYPLSEIFDLILVVVEYCLPLFAGMGVLHFFLCDESPATVWRIIAYALAVVISFLGFVILVGHHDDIRKQNDEIKELQKVKSWHEETSASLEIAESLLTEEQLSEYYKKLTAHKRSEE